MNHRIYWCPISIYITVLGVYSKGVTTYEAAANILNFTSHEQPLAGLHHGMSSLDRRISMYADSVAQSSPIKRTLSDTVEFLTNHPPIFAGVTGDMDDQYEVKAPLVAAINDLKARLATSEAEHENSQRENQRLVERCEEAVKAVERCEANIREQEETIELLKQDEGDRIQKSKERDAQHKRDMAEMIMERDQAVVSRDDLLTKVERFSQTNRDLAHKVTELRRLKDQSADHKQRAKDEAERKAPESTRNFAPPAELPPQDLEKEAEKNELRIRALEQQVKDLTRDNLESIIKESERESDRIRLENQVSDLEVTVARLNDENENYQVMIQQKTVNGEILNADFLQPSESAIGGNALGSLAEELEAADDEDDEDESSPTVEKEDKISQLQATLKRQTQIIKDLTIENKDLHSTKKAQGQYINNIITRVLQFGDLQEILNVNPEETARAAAAHKTKLNTQKDLPAPPSGRSSSDSDRLPPINEGGIAGYIRRGLGSVRRSRPSSTVIAPSPNQPPWENLTVRNDQISPVPTPLPPGQNESPQILVSVPLNQGRGHRRTQSEKSNDFPAPNAPAPAAIMVNNMFRPSPNGPSSPASPGGTTNRNSYFPSPLISRAVSGVSAENKVPPGPRSVSTTSTPPQAMQPSPHDSSRNPSGTYTASTTGTTIVDSVDGDDSRSVVGPPRNAAGMTQYTSAVTTQKGMRPLRMVQVQNDNEAAKKKANRQSWFGGMFAPKGS